jgi:hypothetical protein
MLGPAIAGVLIASIGTGWVFLINGVSFSTVLCALALIRVRELHRSKREARTRVNLLEGFRYVWNRPDLKVVLVMIFLLGAFGLNFQLFISTMAVGVFNVGAGQYGLLTSVMAVGSVLGALYAAGRERPTIPTLTVAAAMFGLGCALASIMPSYLLFALSLAPIADSHHLHQQPHAALHHSRDARPGHRHHLCGVYGLNAARQPHRRMGGGHSESSLGAVSGSRRGILLGGRRRGVSAETSPCAAAIQDKNRSCPDDGGEPVATTSRYGRTGGFPATYVARRRAQLNFYAPSRN